MRRWLSAGFLLVTAVAPVAGQSRARIQVDTAVITVGDRVTMTVSVDHPASSRAELPDSLALDPLELLGVSALPVETTPDGVRSTWTLTLTAFELGDLEIPSIPIEITADDGSVDTASTAAYGVRVQSVGVDDSGDIRDIRGPLGIPISTLVLALWVLVPLLAAMLLYWLARKLRPRGEETRRPALGPLPRPPHDVALEALAALEASQLLERGQVKEYHIAASDILRTYVEGRFRVEALEMTTREVLEGLSEIGADAPFRVGLRTFLESCDLVKFAKARPDADTSRAALELGRRIIRESVPRPAAAQPEPAEVEGVA